jgi:hypothetical protein
MASRNDGREALRCSHCLGNFFVSRVFAFEADACPAHPLMHAPIRALHVHTPRGLADTCHLLSSSHILRDALTMTKPVRAQQLVCPVPCSKCD